VFTQSPREYFLHEVTWIDGLDDEAIRQEVVEAMLRKPGRYEGCLTDRFSREGGHQPTDVPSLWRFAIQSQHWPVIPTTMGPTELERRPPEEAWFLSQDLRSTREDRYAFLACVPVWLSAARNLLNSLGVVTVEQAPVARLTAALQEVAAQIQGASAASLRHIEAMATDLYVELQARMKGGEQAKSLLSLAKGPVPLLRDERITVADLKEVEYLFVDDDPIRRQRLHQCEHGWFLPKRFRQTYNELISALRACPSPKNVIRVSECALKVNFQAEEEVNLLDFLEMKFAGEALAVDLGLLIVKCGVVAASPHDESFAQTWRVFKQTRLARGTFADDVPGGACFDAQQSGGPIMMVDASLSHFQIVGEMWQLVGTAYQHAWRAYARALEDGKTASFFGTAGVTPTERTEVEAVIGGNFTQRLGRFRPVILARWMQFHTQEKVERFVAEWAAHTKSADLASSWLEWPELETDVHAAVQAGEPEGSLNLLDRMNIQVSEWQRARKVLGESPFQFERSRDIFLHACRILAGRCRAWFAWLVVPRSHSPGLSVDASLADTVFDWTEQIHLLQAPSEVCEAPWDVPTIVQKAAREALRLAAERPPILGTVPLMEPLRDLALVGSNLAEIKLRSEPDAAATIYEREVEEHRNRDAAKAIEVVIKIATALAQHYQEMLDEEEIRQSPLVRLLVIGRWANRYSVLAAVRGALEEAAPQTTARMQKGNAFRPVEDWQMLWKRFEAELGPVAKPAPFQPAPAKFSVLSGVWTQAAFLASAGEGDEGVLAKELAQAVVPNLDLLSLQFTRGQVQIHAAGKGGRKRKGGGGGGGKRPPDEYLNMLGAVGEYFVYRQLEGIIPGFSKENWKSRNREIFGAKEGNDSLGYDFEFYDARGTLNASRVPRQYFLEVKSTASVDFGEDFEMSMNEWETAQLHTASIAGWNGPLYVIACVAGTASTPRLVDLLMDPVALRAQGVLDYSSRDLIISVGEPK
jgi:hypothetical protein